MGIYKIGLGLLALTSLGACCNHVEVRHNICCGTVACPKDPCAPVDILSGRPNRPWQPLGVVQVRVDRTSALRNPTLNDAIPPLQQEARAMGADAVILTHEEFTSWYDKGEDVSPIHDLERQETWYITEKARFLSGLAVVYTGPCYAAPPPCAPGMPRAAAPPPYSPPVVQSPAPAYSTYTPPPASPEAPPVVPTGNAPLPAPRRLQ